MRVRNGDSEDAGMTCNFCEAIQKSRQITEFYNEYEPIDKELGRYMDEYTVAIVTHHWYQKKGKRSGSRSTDYRNRGLGYALNYCPECGKRMDG